MHANNKINITTIGWWNWSYGILSSIRDNDDYNISAIISMSDSWGSTGVLREEFWILPPWDVRRAVMALSREHELVKNLFDYRYWKNCSVWGHNLWNLLITAMTDITWSFDKWLKQICKMFRVKWRVIPVTLELSNLNVELEDGLIVEWETNIDLNLNEKSSPIKRAYLTPEVNANNKAIKAIEKSDAVKSSELELRSIYVIALDGAGYKKILSNVDEVISRRNDTNKLRLIYQTHNSVRMAQIDIQDFRVITDREIAKMNEVKKEWRSTKSLTSFAHKIQKPWPYTGSSN